MKCILLSYFGQEVTYLVYSNEYSYTSIKCRRVCILLHFKRKTISDAVSCVGLETLRGDQAYLFGVILPGLG